MMILPGVSVGDRCVIGAGSIVVDDVPAASAVVGNPAPSFVLLRAAWTVGCRCIQIGVPNARRFEMKKRFTVGY